MACKGLNRRCALKSGHLGKCQESNQIVTIEAVTCNQCVTKDEEIMRLRNQIVEMESKNCAKPKRDRAQYMRQYRKKPLGIAYG